MRHLFCILIQLVFIATATATTNVTLRFVPTYAGNPIVLEDKYYQLPGGDSVMFETFKCYISDLAFYENGKKVAVENNSYHLLNAAEEDAMSFSVNISANQRFDNVHFNIGIDSATSNSGALGGDLDPGKGMFWTWQSGYINCKIEGKSNLCKTRHNAFELHLGGYAYPDNTLQRIALKVKNIDYELNDIVIEIPLDKFLSTVDLRKEHSIMSPGPEAVQLSKKLAKVFFIK